MELRTFFICAYLSLLLSHGIFFRRSLNAYVLQQYNKSNTSLHPTQFVHVVFSGTHYTCECRTAQHTSTSCYHEQVCLSGRLQWESRSPFPADDPYNVLNAGVAAYITEPAAIVPLVSYTYGRIKRMFSVQGAGQSRLAIVTHHVNNRFMCRIHRSKGCEHAHLARSWLFSNDSDIDEENASQVRIQNENVLWR